MDISLKWARRAVFPVALVLGGVGVYEYLLRRPLPKVNGTISLRGLDGSAEVIRDEWGVPHIYASTFHDLCFAQGYVHAQDRLWQLEFQRRLGSGRLAEVFGGLALEADRFMRRVGMHRVARVEADSLSGEAGDALKAYCAGVNAYVEVAGRNLPIEYTLLRIKPEPWKEVDTLIWAKTINWGLSTNWETELLRARLVALLGPDEAARLEPSYPSGHPLVLPPGVDYGGIGEGLLEVYQEIKELLQISSEAVGSNNWVVDGEKSTTGKPLLANDPHLLPLAPSLWYEVHLSAPGLNVVGASFPGTPGVIIGHNERIAWGVTNSMADVQDLYVEKLNPEDPSLYEYRGKWEEAQLVREEITVRGQAQPVVEEVKITRHGPVITPVEPSQLSPLALSWVGLEPSNPIAGILELNQASSWEEFSEALRHFAGPSQNFVYADVDGNIGYYLSGKIPIRAKGNGMVPVPGWTGEYEWTGFIPFEELPHALNPDSHFIVTANNKVVPDDYPYFITAEWHTGYRARRIADLIQAQDKLSVDDFKLIQGDYYSLPCSEIAEHLLELPPRNRWQEDALKHVAGWDGFLGEESVGGTICQVFLWHLRARVFGQKLPGLLNEYLGVGLHPVAPKNAFFGRSTPILIDLLNSRDDAWFCHLEADGEEVQQTDWQSCLENSFAETVAFLRQRLGDDISKWQWGKLHRVTFAHIFANLRPLRALFSRGSFPLGGDSDTVCQSAYLPHEPFEARSIVSYRQVVNLSDWRNSFMMHAPGQSGHPASAHYDDLVASWRTIQYHPMLYDRDDVLVKAKSVLWLAEKR